VEFCVISEKLRTPLTEKLREMREMAECMAEGCRQKAMLAAIAMHFAMSTQH
jgi:hypothetical protein